MWYRIVKKLFHHRMILSLSLLAAVSVWNGRDFLQFVTSKEQNAGIADLIIYSIQKEEFVWLLPLTISILCGGDTWAEIESRFLLFSVSRIGTRRYLLYQVFIPIFVAAVYMCLFPVFLGVTFTAILFDAGTFTGIFVLTPVSNSVLLFLRLLLISMLWAIASELFALAMKSTYAALVCPFVLCYVMVIFQRRYYPGFTCISPMDWIIGGVGGFTGLILLLFFFMIGYLWLLKWRTNHA